MVEKNLKSDFKKPDNVISLEQWLAQYVNEKILKGSALVTPTYKNAKNRDPIPEYQAVHIFRPTNARGELGVMLTEYLGIASLKEIIELFLTQGSKDPIAIFPMGIPIAHAVVHNLAGTWMLSKQWRR